MPSSNFVEFIQSASGICLGPNVKSLVSRWKQICPLKINIFTLNALISTNKVSMFKLAIEVCIENYFGLIHAIFLLLGLTKSVCFFWDTRYSIKSLVSECSILKSIKDLHHSAFYWEPLIVQQTNNEKVLYALR